MAVRKMVAVIVLIVFVSVAAPLSFAETAASGVVHSQPKMGVSNDGAWKKLGRGVCNTLTFPFELPNQISRTNRTDGPMAAFTWGLIKGVGMTGFRALVGVYEMISFPVALPEDYKPILTDPEFFFDGELCLY